MKMKKFTKITFLMILVLGLAFSQAQAATIYLANQSQAFVNDFSPITVENFEDQILNPGLTITSGWGGGTYNGVTYSGGSIVDGAWFDQVGSSSSTTFAHTAGFRAFGGFFNLAEPGGPGSNIAVTAIDFNNNSTYIGEIANTYVGGFWGFALDDKSKFEKVVFSKGTGTGVETYFSVDLRYAVPEPTTMVLFGLGLIGIAGIGRKKFIK